MSREINYGPEARQKLKNGVDKLADAVKSTLGAKGRNVIIQRDFGAPIVTKDGVTVAQNISLEDPIENMGAEMVKEVAGKALELAADGTTTSTVIAQAIIEEGFKVLNKKKHWFLNRYIVTNPIDLKRGIDIAAKDVVEYLKSIAEDISKDNNRVCQVATISANGDKEIGELIASAMAKVTVDGVVTIEESKGNSTYVEVVEGVQFINGLLSPYFVTNPEKAVAEFDNPLIFLYSKKVSNTKEILPVIEEGLKTGRPLVIVADDFEGEVIATLAQNRVQKGFQIAAVKSPSFGEKRKDMMEDLAIITGGTVLSEEKGLTVKDFSSDMFGESKKISISKERTTIVGGAGSKESIDKRVDELKKQITTTSQEIDDKIIRDRISKLSGGVAVIYVGANSELEMLEKKDRVDDALHATKAGIEEGIICGGGVSLLSFVEDYQIKGSYRSLPNKDQKIGYDILMKAIQKPIKQIAANAGLDGDRVMEDLSIMGYPFGYNAREDRYEDMLAAGIIDPVKITRVALESAVSIASLLLTTEATISNIK